MIEKPEKWKAAHGMGYTRFEAEKDGLAGSLTFFVGNEENGLICNLNLQINRSKQSVLGKSFIWLSKLLFNNY